MAIDGPIRRAVRDLHGALRRADERVAVAESCTGGLVGTAITAEPGSSDIFELGVVSYSDASKHRILDVPEMTLDYAGAVSGPTARAMAAGVRAVGEVTWGLSITGIAGPGGGRPGKPVGTVYIGIATADEAGERSTARRVRFDGDRAAIRRQTTLSALQRLTLAVGP